MHSQQHKDYDSSPPAPCAELDYLDIHSQPGEMRYTQEANTSTLAIEPSQPSTLLNLFHPPVLGATPQYPQDGAAFYQPAPHIFPGPDARSRLNPNTAPSTGMAHAHAHAHSQQQQHQHQQQHHRTSLPHPPAQLSARDQYSTTTPSFGRATEHPTRSSSFAGAPLRRHPLSPTPSPLAAFAAPAERMDAGQYQNRPSVPTVPPLLPLQMAGALQYVDGTPIKVDITGTVDKGFFLAEGEWTCYRRNYMACACSYTLHPHFAGASIQYTPTGSAQAFQVYGFSMCISAVVADNDQHSIELVQHTPKRDKGPISKPEKIQLAPKNSVPAHHVGLYSDSPASLGARGVYPDGFGGSQPSGQPATEHTFERIQFKQATQNNGKRRAAQQYYHLMVELWVDVDNQVSDKYLKIAHRKSEKMIVRGRSPGHYQNEKRRSHSSGPGGSAGTLGSYTGMAGIGEFSPNMMGGSGSYTTSYDARGSVYGGSRHHDIPAETTMSSEEEKAIGSTKGYQYYPGPIYEGQPPRVDMFSHRNEPETAVSQMASESKVKHEYELGMMPRVFHPPPMMENRRQNGPFEGKTTSSGYYPATLMTPPGANMNMP